MSLTVHRWWEDAEARARTESVGTPAQPEKWIIDWYRGGAVTDSGMDVSPETALRMSAVYACVAILSGIVASLPIKVFRRSSGGKIEEVNDHPGAVVMREDATPEQSSHLVRRTMQAHQELRGNGFAYIERSGGTDPVALWPLMASRVEVLRRGQRRFYRVWLLDGGSETCSADEILHVPAVSLDGMVGLGPIEQCRQAVGLGLAAEKFGARFFGSGSAPVGYLHHPSKALDKPVRDRMREEWNERMQGPDRSHLVAVLTEGVEYRPLGIAPEQAQFLETRGFQVADICRIFGVPSFLVNDSEKSTAWGSGLEQIFRAFKNVTLIPRTRSWEAECNRKLLRVAERGTTYFRHNFDAFLEADSLTRARVHQIEVLTGWKNRNEVRWQEDLNPADGLDEYLEPQNMRLAGDPLGTASPDQVVNGGGQ